MTKANAIWRLISKTNGRFFSVVFEKKDGTLRKMVCRTGVKKHLKGGTLKHNPAEFGHCIVWDVQKKAYRTINMNTVLELKT
jgi:hypothetical protein